MKLNAEIRTKRTVYLSQIVEVVLVSNPLVRWIWFGDAVGLVIDVTDVRALAVVKRTFKQLPTKTHNDDNSEEHKWLQPIQ